MNKKYKDGIYIGKEATNEKVIFEKFKQQPLNNLELGKIGEGKKVVIDEGIKNLENNKLVDENTAEVFSTILNSKERKDLIKLFNILKKEKINKRLDFDICVGTLSKIFEISNKCNIKFKKDLNNEEIILFQELESTFEELTDIFHDL